jgi:hypothetical protein
VIAGTSTAGELKTDDRVGSGAPDADGIGDVAAGFSLVAGVSGLVFLLLFLGPLFGFALGPSPASGPADVAAYYARHGSTLQSIQFLRALATVFFLVFLAGLWGALRRVEGRSGAAATGVVAAGVVMAAIGLVLFAARQSIALNAAQLQDPAVVQAIRDFANALEAFTSVPAAVLVVLASWILLGGRGAGRRIGQAGFPVAALLLLGPASTVSGALRPFGPAGFLASNLWLAALALLLSARAVRHRAAARPS